MYTFFKINFSKNGYAETFRNKCFERFMDIYIYVHVVKETTLTVKDQPFDLVLPYFGYKKVFIKKPKNSFERSYPQRSYFW